MPSISTVPHGPIRCPPSQASSCDRLIEIFPPNEVICLPTGVPGTSPRGKLQSSCIPRSCAAPHSCPLFTTYLGDLNSHKVLGSCRPQSAEARERESVAEDAPHTPAAADGQGGQSPSRSRRAKTPVPSRASVSAPTSSRQYPRQRSVPAISKATSRARSASEARGERHGWGSESVAPCLLLHPFGFSGLRFLFAFSTVNRCCAFRTRKPIG